MILQLNPFLEVETPKGPGLARLIIDYSPEINAVFLVSLDSTGQFLFFDCVSCHASANYTYAHAIGTSSLSTPNR